MMQQKVKFDLHPLEKGYKDHLSNYSVPNHFTMVGKNINDIELEIQSRDREEMIVAAQA
jgi:predicted SpoU family rRNA methylase